MCALLKKSTCLSTEKLINYFFGILKSTWLKFLSFQYTVQYYFPTCNIIFLVVSSLVASPPKSPNNSCSPHPSSIPCPSHNPSLYYSTILLF